MCRGTLIIYEPAEASAFRQRLLSSPGERQEVDYKSSVAFSSDDAFSLKLIRHVQGMANAGGGWLVIGYAEIVGKGLEPDPRHEDRLCDSYEPTRFVQRVNSAVVRGQQLSLTVYFERHPDTGLRYPLVSIEGFDRTPYVCRTTQKAADTGDPGGRRWDQRGLRDAARRAELRNTGWPIGLVRDRPGDAPLPMENGIEARILHTSDEQWEDYWAFFTDGSYYVVRLFEEDFHAPSFSSSEGHPDKSL